MPVQVTHNNDGHFYTIDVDIAKEGAEVFDLSTYFKARVADNHTGLRVRWFWQGQILNTVGKKPRVEGVVGQYSFKKGSNGTRDLVMSPDASPVASDGDVSACEPGGYATYYFPQQMFPQEGLFKGTIGLVDDLDEGAHYTSVDIWFKVYPQAGSAQMGRACDFYISELDKAIKEAEDDLTAAKKSMQKVVDDFTAKMNDLSNQITTQVNTDKAALAALETKIAQDDIVTKPQLDAFKQSIQQELNELAKFGFEESSEDSVIAQQARSLYSYASEGLAKRNALASNVLRVGTLNLALAGALNIGIDVGNFWSETDKASRRLTENQMAMDWMGCNIVGCQEVISSMLSGAYNSYNRAMAEDQMYPNLYVGLSPEINHQLQTWNGMREGNALFADRQMSYVALTAYSSDTNRSYLAYQTDFNNKNVLVVVTHNNVNDESEFEELATFCAQQTFDACIILADTNNDPDSQCIAKLLAAGFDIVSKKDDNTMITEPSYSGHQMQIFYKGCVLQKKELYDVTTFEGSDHKAIVAEFKVGD